jgi:hypothetical protein
MPTLRANHLEIRPVPDPRSSTSNSGETHGASLPPTSFSRRNTATACDNSPVGDRGEAGLSPAQVLLAVLILAVVALVIVVALRRVGI